MFSSLLRPSPVPEELLNPQTLETFQDTASQFERILSDSGLVSLERLKEEALLSRKNSMGLIERYCTLAQGPRFIQERYLAYAASIVLALVSLSLAPTWPAAWWGVAVFGALALLGTWDVLQTRSTLRRNYPVLAHFRYGLESVGPEIRQYFIEGDTAEVPFSRQQRALVYQRAKGVSDVVPFGSQQDVYGVDYEWINHSMAPSSVDSHDFRVVIGAGTAQPYSASVFNISAMSFGSLSANAVRALNEGARRGNFYHDTGEGSISPYHREKGGASMCSAP